MQDDTLLTQYARRGSEAAFSQIVARHLTLVYATCLRETGSPSQAEDAAQVVFLLLARKARTLRAGPSLAGWLYATARFVAKDVRKQETRRQQREERVMQELAHDRPTPSPEWDAVEPRLNDALSALKPAEREAVLLRFAEGHSLAETGALLGITEDAARMRVARAVEKMRRYLTAHGAAVTGLALTALLTTEAARPMPAHAAAAVTQATLQAIYTGPSANVLLLSKGVSHAMKLIKVKYAALTAGLLLAGASVPPLVHALDSKTPPAVQATVTQTIVLQHVIPADVLKSLHGDRLTDLPAGVTSIQALPARNAIVVTATAAGLAKVQSTVKFLDAVSQQVQIRSAFAYATDADIKASGVESSLIPLQGASSGPALVRYASGSAVARLLQTLMTKVMVNQMPDVTTTDNVAATINFSTKLPGGRTKSTEAAFTPHINSNGSVTVTLHEALADGTVKHEISAVRTITNGAMLVLIVPPVAALPAGENMLVFVTPTVK